MTQRDAESTKGRLNVDGDPGSTIIWTSLENDILFPVIALSLLLWSPSPLGVTSRLTKAEKGEISTNQSRPG